MEIHSTSSGMQSSSYSSSTSGNNPLKSGGISPTSSSALARVTAQDASFSKFSLGSAQSEASVSQRAHQTLALLREACQKTCTLGEKINKKNWLQINKTQCREFLRLRSLASALAKFFEELKNEAPDVQAECWTTAREMYKVIIITEEFVEDCSLPITPVRALKNFANGTNFVLIQYQLIWCIRVLKMVLCQAKGESNADFGSDLNDMDQCLSEEEKVDLEGYCTTDRKALLKKLEENTHPLKLKKSGPRSEGPEGRILKLLRRLAEENGMRGNSSSFVSSQGEGPSIMEQRVFSKCVYVEITELKKEKGPILGRGSYGSVFCANWLGEKVAVKNVQANYNVFKQEVGLQSGLWHPHILPLYAYSFDPVKEICYMVMELAQGNLRTYISTHGRNLTLESKVDTMLQIAEGMRYLHSKNLMHRDLKAENILVQWKGITALQDAQNVQAKVCDFGLATTKFNGSISIHRTLNVGASFWRAPEVLIESSGSDNNQRVDYRQKADVYSFAMIFYEVLTGKIPFQDVNISLSNFRVRVLNGERPELPRDCPDYLACYIKRCWHGLPEKRPSFADICKMLRHFRSLLLRIGERPPIDFNIFSIFTAADFEAIRYHLGMRWCINAIREGIVFKDVLLSWIIVEQYRLNARDEEEYNEVLLVAAENFADITGPGHDFPRAFNFIQDAAHSGYAEAQWKVGLFLELGWGVEKNETEAINWYNAAAEQNYVCALVELGRCYHLGRGVEKRDDKAVEYCRRAHNNSEDQTIRCIHELLIMLNQTKDPKHSEIAAKRLFELTFEEGRPLILGPNLHNIQYLVDALDKNATYEIGRHIVLILKEMAVDAEVKEEIIYSGGVAAIVKHLKMVKANNEWRRDAVETLGILFDGSGTEAVYFSVQHDLIAVLDECLCYNAPCFVNVLIQCLEQNVSKLWLRRNSQVISSLMNVHSRAPGISNDKALEIRQRLAYFGFTDQA